MDQSFDDVIQACADPRADGSGTWITTEMQEAYCALHQLGHAHSVETWLDGRLVGGLYGVSVGGIFCGESMFHRESDASKVALVALCRRMVERGFALLDCQVHTSHLASMGAVEVSRREFLRVLGENVDRACRLT